MFIFTLLYKKSKLLYAKKYYKENCLYYYILLLLITSRFFCAIKYEISYEIYIISFFIRICEDAQSINNEYCVHDCKQSLWSYLAYALGNITTCITQIEDFISVNTKSNRNRLLTESCKVLG